MNDIRPNPEQLLEKILEDENKENQGKLKIFFGYAAGVGKTYTMLEAAHEAKKSGVDVVVGYVEPHTRPDTINLLEGLEVLPTKNITRRGITLKEFDIDSAIKRKPQLILVDELAHTNAKESRNLKRYQDIEELLKAGIDVYTTINVQHIESLNDMVHQITGVTVNERTPDRIIDNADKIELIDIEPEELISRLNKGKIYKDAQAKRALQNFFTKQNLLALREISLRRIANQINKKAEKSKSVSNSEFFTNEHILICLSTSPSNAKVIRTAARMVDAFHGEFTALFVETSEIKKLSKENRDRLKANLKLAEQLGAKIITVYGDDIPEQIAQYAKVAEVSKVVIGRSNNKRGLIPKKSFIERLTQIAPNLDIYVIPDNLRPYVKRDGGKNVGRPIITLKDSLKLISIIACVTILGLCFYKLGFTESNIITIYILGVVFVAVSTEGKFYSTFSSIISVFTFNYFFTEPRYTMQVYDMSYIITFIVMFIAAMLTSSLTMRVKEQSYENAIKARSTEVLLETSQKLQKANGINEIYDVIGRQILKLLDRTVMIYPVYKSKELGEPISFQSSTEKRIREYTTANEWAVAEWVLRNNKNAGATTNTLSGARCLYMAIRGKDTVQAVVGISLKDNEISSHEKNLLIAMLGEFGLSLEKETINEIKKEIHVKAKQEQLRANLLRAISHDLRTPLTSISGNASILMGNEMALDKEKKIGLYTDIYDDSMWLINLVENLLSVTRIDNGTMSINMQPELIEEVITEALRHINRRKCEYKIYTEVSDDLIMAQMDSRLIVQVIINIVDNAIKYTPPGSEIRIRARSLNKEMVIVDIIDNGEGIIDEDKVRLFDMFFTSDKNKGDSRRGLGLGLSLCKSIIDAHGGNISVRGNIPKGTIFSFTLRAKEISIYE